jgi:peroxiredoxin
MTITVGDKVPDIELKTIGPDGTPVAIRTGDVLGSGKVVLFAVPGAFTPGCSNTHLPGYVQNADALKSDGVDLIVCVAVNDAWVLGAWAETQGVGDKILMLADGSASFTDAMGLSWDVRAAGLGIRSKRYVAVLEDGVIKRIDVEQGGAIDVSSCEAVRRRL